MRPAAFFTASVQPWQRFHQWLAEVARFGDSLDVGVRERNEDSGFELLGTKRETEEQV